jgi:hypothetical protein
MRWGSDLRDEAELGDAQAGFAHPRRQKLGNPAGGQPRVPHRAARDRRAGVGDQRLDRRLLCGARHSMHIQLLHLQAKENSMLNAEPNAAGRRYGVSKPEEIAGLAGRSCKR